MERDAKKHSDGISDGLRAVIYARYSSDNQREESIEGQIRENTAFAEKNGLRTADHICHLLLRELHALSQYFQSFTKYLHSIPPLI